MGLTNIARRLNAIRARQASAVDSCPSLATPGDEIDQLFDSLVNQSATEQVQAQFEHSTAKHSISSVNHIESNMQVESFDLNSSPMRLSEPILSGRPATDFREQAFEEQSIIRPDHDTRTSIPAENIENLTFSRHDLLAELSIFCAESYQRYPILHLVDLFKRVDREDHVSDSNFRTLLLSILLVNEASRFRRYPARGTAHLDLLSRATEASRADSSADHFADFPSLDTVLVSIFLFIGQSVRDQHNRAFLYLTEAIGLMDLVKYPSDQHELERYHRIECLLFVTEAASNVIYGACGKRRIAKVPSNPALMGTISGWYVPEDQQEELSKTISPLDYNALDKQAVQLLYAMTCLYGALDTAEVVGVAFKDNTMGIMNGADSQKPSCSLQAADVAVTRQWQLAAHWWRALSADECSPQVKDSARYTIQIIGMSAVQHTRFLRPEACRVVGHGKLAVLADTMFKISSAIGILPCCSSLIRDMIQIVSRADYEKCFAPGLSLLEVWVGEVPRPVASAEEIGYAAHRIGNTARDLLLEN